MGDSTRNDGSDRSRELERRLAESERRLEESQALARIGSWEWDLEELSANWSKELLRIFGRDPQGAQPSLDELIAAVHPDDREEFREFVARVRATPGRFHHSYRIIDAEGSTHYLQARGRAVNDAGGKPVRAFGTTQDITDLRLSERDLQLRVQQQAGVAALGRYALSAPGLQALMEEAVRMVASVLCVDLVEMLELDEREEVFRIKAGVGWEPGTVGQAVPSNCSQMAHAIDEGVALVSDYNSETRFAPAELLSRHGARSGIAAVIEGADRAYGVIGAHSTKARRFSLDDAHFLQAVGNVLGAALERERGEQIKAQLEQAQRLEAVGQLAGGVAHDFNNLLMVILSYTECLLAEGGEEQAISGLREIERAASSAADLTRQLLLFSRREQPDRRGVDLVTAVRETEALLRRTIGEHIELRVDTPAGLPAVNLGVGEADQILVNLAVNARDALPQGGTVQVVVQTSDAGELGATRGLDRERQHLTLTVSDDGEGMSDEVAAQAFDPFFTTKPRGQGTGLGLATVYGIVNQAGGAIEIQSEPGRGTAVRVHLPVADEAETAGAGAKSEEAAPGDGRTVLVVDNERAVRTIVCHMLERHGYRACAAASGAAAEEIFENGGGDVDLLLTDVLMPGISGRELVERVRADNPSLRAIYMSGYSGDASSPLGQWDEGAALLEKPFTAVQLMRAVGEALA